MTGPKRITADDLAAWLPAAGRVFVQGCSGESPIWPEALAASGPQVGALTFTGIFVPGLNRSTYLVNPQCRVETFFMTPELKRAGAAVDFLPLCYQDALAHLRRVPIQAAIFSVAPPDEKGWCSFGPVVDFLAEIWPRIPVRIAHVNPQMPRTRGVRGIPWRDLTAVVDADTPLPIVQEGADSISATIAQHVAPWIDDFSTLQIGLGRIPGAVMASLRSRRGLRIHSGLIGDGVIDLLDAGALAGEDSVLSGVAIGTQRLYDRLSEPPFTFRPVSYTHSALVLGKLQRLVTINSALQVDLFGQVYSEATGRGLMSGPGGASDFARGARLANGLRIIALPSTAGGESRIVSPAQAIGPVSLGRFDVDLVVTEHGVADLRAGGHAARAEALIAVADPVHRPRLCADWALLAGRL